MALTSTILGPQTTVNQLAANQMPDIDRMLYLLEPYQTPLMQKLFFGKGKSEKCINANGKFEWFEDELVPHQTTISNITGGAASEDNITVGSTNPFNEGDVFLIEDTEQLIYVDSVASNLIDITTLNGDIITACTTGYIRKVGSRNHEFDVARPAQMTKEIAKFNYCTIFSETVTTSGRYQAGEKYTGGKSHAEQVQKKILEMKLTYERNFWFSTLAYSGTISTNYRFTFGEGVLSRVSTNKIQYTGVLSEAVWDDFLKTVFTAKGSSNNKDVYVGGNVLAAISKFVKDKYREASITKEYGVDITTYITGFGRINVIWNPLFEGKFQNYAFAIDPKNIKMRYMADDDKGSRKFRIEENVQTPGTDGKSTKILSDLGVQIANEEIHGILHP
jgi:hypothetical protein